MTVATMPPQVFSGDGSSAGAADNAAAQQALAALLPLVSFYNAV